MSKSILFSLAIALLYVNGAEAKKLYGTAGCGLGNMVFGKDNQILAATTNGTSNSQMFGITTGTSNCQDHGASASNRLPAFVESNKVALANDVARGEGVTLAALSEVLGCSDTAKVSASLQKNYTQIFPNGKSETDQVTDSIIDVVKTDGLECENVI